MRSFASKIQPRLLHPIYLVTGGQDRHGRRAWYYVQVPLAKSRSFTEALTRGALNLGEYGTVLESGFGDVPPPYVAERMAERYGFTPEPLEVLHE